MNDGRAPDPLTDALLEQLVSLEKLLRSPAEEAIEDLELCAGFRNEPALDEDLLALGAPGQDDLAPSLPLLDDVVAPGPGLREAFAVRNEPMEQSFDDDQLALLVEQMIDARLAALRETLREAILAELKHRTPRAKQ